MGKEVNEIICIENLMKANCSKKTETYLKKIRSFDIVQEWRESPDFLLKKDDEYIGVEHFVVDIFNTKIDGMVRSGSRLSCNEATRIFEKYHEQLVNGALNSEAAIADINRYMQADNDSLTKFSYDEFVSKFEAVFDKHLKKVEKYKNNIETATKNKRTPIYFMIETRLLLNMVRSDIYSCHMTTDKGNVISSTSLRHIPITKDMLRIMENAVGTIDGIYLLSFHLNDFQNKLIDIKYIDLKSENAIIESLYEQKMSLFSRFDFRVPKINYKLRVEKSKEEIE